MSGSGEGIYYDPESDTYRLTVTNDAGYELPSTGGSGTLQFYITGLVLICLAGAGLLLKRRKRSAF